MAKKLRSPSDSEMLAFLQSRSVDHVSDYSQRGRFYRSLSDNDLIRSWKTVWDSLENDPLNEKLRDTQADLSAEFSLRGIEPPWALVARQIDIFVSTSERAHKDWCRDNPAAAAEAEEQVREDLGDFLEDRKRPN